MRLTRRHWMALLALGILGGTVAAFAHTERLKLERSPVGKARFDRWLSPVCDCPSEVARLSFELRERERITVSVVAGDRLVRRLATGLERRPGRLVFTWDGRDDAGRVVPDGTYHLRVRLLDARRTIVVPRDVIVDTRPPRARILAVSPAAPTGGERLLVRYRANELASPTLLVDGRVARSWPARHPGERELAWDGLLGGAALEPGAHSVAVRVEDRAGNLSEPSDPFTVVVLDAAPQP